MESQTWCLGKVSAKCHRPAQVVETARVLLCMGREVGEVAGEAAARRGSTGILQVPSNPGEGILRGRLRVLCQSVQINETKDLPVRGSDHDRGLFSPGYEVQ